MKQKRRPTYTPPTPEALQRAAERYLARFAASESSVRRILTLRIRRAAMMHPAFAADEAAQAILHSTIENILAKYKANGVLNDAAFADMKRISLRRAGRSRSAITNKLHAKGVAADIIAQTMQQERDDTAEDRPDAEIIAALKFTKRKRIGRYAKTEIDPEQRHKHIASMARAGFSFATIKKVMGDSEDLPIDDNC